MLYAATASGATVVRYYVNAYSARVELSDGRILDRSSPRLGSIGPNWVEIDGERILWRAAPSDFYRAPEMPSVSPYGAPAPAPAADRAFSVQGAALETVRTWYPLCG